MEVLQTRANSDNIRMKSNRTKGSSRQSSRHRQHQSRGTTFHTTNRTLVCPTCHGPHEIRHWKVFKVYKIPTKRFELAKQDRTSLCTNFLDRERTFYYPMFRGFVSHMWTTAPHIIYTENQPTSIRNYQASDHRVVGQRAVGLGALAVK